MAWIDSSFTHRRTGIYATMFLSAAISCAQVLEDKMEIIETALEFVPQKSRFFERSLASYLDVKNSINWEDGYAKINNKLGEYGHCRIYQEIGMVINTFKHAKDIGHGIYVYRSLKEQIRIALELLLVLCLVLFMALNILMING